MKAILAVLAVLCFATLGVKAAHYAVLVAGSNGFYNYRHQADIFHAYQSLISYGYDADNIITFAYDDIAQDIENPFRGQVFNKPTDGAGKDVYGGVKIDYSGKDVTPANFLGAITGSVTLQNAKKKVLQSTENDNVFIYFADHGASGLIAFPSQYLYADDFMAALNKMNEKKKYKQMVIYIEACESGSMFQGILPQNISIYATTAANAEESSWGTYCSPDDKVNGKSIGSCLGDLYSVNFLENLDSVDPSVETLISQYGVLVNETDKSHVQRFGDISISNQVIGNFEANNASAPLLKNAEKTPKVSNVHSRMIKLAYLQNKFEQKQTAEAHNALTEEMASIQKFDTTFTTLAQQFKLDTTAPVRDINFACLKERVEMYESFCGKFSDYGLQYIKYLHYSCAQGVDTYDLESALLSKCF